MSELKSQPGETPRRSERRVGSHVVSCEKKVDAVRGSEEVAKAGFFLGIAEINQLEGLVHNRLPMSCRRE